MRVDKHYKEAELNTLLESVTDIVIVGNKSGIYRCNKLALDFFNVKSPEELNAILPSLGGNNTIHHALTGKKLGFDELPFNKAIHGENHVIDITFIRDESEIKNYFHCHGVPIKHEEKIIGAVLILTNYTFEKAAREAISNALNKVEEIKKINKRLEKYSQAIAHDINSPLNNIQGLSHHLLEEHRETLNPEVISYIEMIYKSSFRLTEYVISLLNLSAINEYTIKKKWVLLDTVIVRIIDELSENYPNIKHIFTFDKGIKVYAEESLLYGVFQNLIINAVKFSSDNVSPKINISTELNENNRQIIIIKDNGLGFNESDEENIFIPDFRSELSSNFPGKGIGLATVQQIINSHGGRIWAKGIPGLGATFYVYIPSE